MGIIDKSKRLLRIANTNIDSNSDLQPKALMQSEYNQVEEMAYKIKTCIAEELSKQSYVSANVLTFLVVEIALSIMKLNYDMWHLDDEELLKSLIHEKWSEIKSTEVKYD
ncbi:MAG: hypothetical protein J6C05_08885 [Prevotella sp.]|nr:hypothetical protein [Prevotella sp.]MBO5157223.1 hypothetical protein [Prevotella sp.]